MRFFKKEEFEFSMQIQRLGQEPRPRKPYTDEQWAGLLAAGGAVDERLRAMGLRLTMGGEPTWTSREHPREPEWNTEALGPTKWTQGLRLARTARNRRNEISCSGPCLTAMTRQPSRDRSPSEPVLAS